MTVSLICPSRGRPERLAGALESAMRLAVGDVEILVYLDLDDPALPRYLDAPAHRGVVYYVGPRVTTTMAAETLVQLSDGDLIVGFNDDAIILTRGWDVKLAAAVPDDGLGVIYPDDCFQHNPTFTAISRRMYEALGYFAHPDYEHCYADTHLGDIGHRIGRLIYVPSVQFDHRHPFAGKAAEDQVYKSSKAGGKLRRDARRFLQLESQRLAQAAKIRGMMA